MASNKAFIGAFFASLHFGMASPLYPKSPLHKNALCSAVSLGRVEVSDVFR